MPLVTLILSDTSHSLKDFVIAEKLQLFIITPFSRTFSTFTT